MVGNVSRFGVVVAALAGAAGCGNVVVVDGGPSGTTTTTDTGGGGGNTTSTTSTPSTSSTGNGGTGGSTQVQCTSNSDCTGDPEGSLCDPAKGKCVACIPVVDPEVDCGIGLYCEVATGDCMVGCTGDADCPYNGAPQVCDLAKHACTGCLDDSGCAPGAVCFLGECQSGCNQNHPCQAGWTCCTNTCHLLDTEVDNCGSCGNACFQEPNAPPSCTNGQCVYPDCTPGFANCDGVSSNGCEHNVLADGPCSCVPGSTQSCYLGAAGTEGVGACHAGVQMCGAAGTSWGPCTGQGLPIPEVCANGVDDDCDGVVDDDPDIDLDGWTSCEGDCDNTDPLVNPGALEINYQLVDDDGVPWTPKIQVEGVGNGKDDDCNPATPDMGVNPACNTVALTSGVTALDLAHALDLCQSAVAGAPKSQRAWGLLSADLLRADGTAPSAAQLADFQNVQTATLTAYGAYAPKKGPTMVGLSSGKMRAPGDAGYVAPSPGTDLGWAGSPPAQFLAAHGGVLPSSAGCNGACPSGTGANDDVSLRVVIRTPSNASSFSFDAAFLSAEYPSAVCTGKNDYFLALLGSSAPGLPQDKNVAFDPFGNPISVSNVGFDVCAPSGCFTCRNGSAGLAGTGMPAATSWFTVQAPFYPGEAITLDLTVFDVSGGAGDTVTLLDALRWNIIAPCEWCP